MISVETADEIPSNMNIHPTTQRYPGIVRGKNDLTIESVADHDMKEIFYSWINGLWTGAKVLPKMSQFTRFSRVKSKNLALAKHWKIPRLSARWDQVETWWNPKTYLFNDAETSWNREMKECFSSWISCWSMTFEGAPRFPKQQNEYWISDLSVQWPGKLITFSLGGSNPEMWYVFSLR